MTMRLTRLRNAFVATAFVALTALPALAAAPGLKPFNADYVANYMGMEGAANMQLVQTGAQWKYTLKIQSSLATLSQVTTFEENGGQWRPLSGSDNASVLIKKTNKQAQYDWAKGVATWGGDVNAKTASAAERNVLITTDRMNIFPQTNRATAAGVVTVEQPGSILRGQGMDARLDSKRVRFSSNVRARYVPSH